MSKRRLIERRLPLLSISTESAREKSIRHGHISTLHIWWARRPLAASRAAVFASLVPDSDENYALVEKIVSWDAVKDGNNKDILEARRRVLEANGGVAPKVLDMFAGGGAIPLEALRLGCETYALDLNPVAHLIQRATLEYPQKYGQPNSRPVPAYIQAKDIPQGAAKQQESAFPDDGQGGAWSEAYRANPLAAEVRYWGEWVLERAKAELAEFYPADEGGKTPVAYLWARTVRCVNPACRAEVPMVRQWWLAKKKNKRLALKHIVNAEQKTLHFEVVEVAEKETWPDNGTITRGKAVCPVCNTAVPNDETRRQGKAGEIGHLLTTVVLTEAKKSGKSYRAATERDMQVFEKTRQKLIDLQEELSDFFTVDGKKFLTPLPDEAIHIEDTRNFWVGVYGITQWGQLFNARQALSLVTFAKWVRAAHGEILEQTNHEDLARGIATYLTIALGRLANAASTLCRWDVTRESLQGVYARQALPMIWDYSEGISISSQTGSWHNGLDWGLAYIHHGGRSSDKAASVLRGSTISAPFEDNLLDAIVTDPPYYDAVPYADLSDFFYVWFRRTVGHLYPEHFRTPTTPKSQEIVQNPVRHGGDKEKAKLFYEEKMTEAFMEMHRVLKPHGQATIVFAHKSTDAWETLISALIRAGFTVEASWPLRTEMATRLRARNSAALASSTFINCSKRTAGQIGYFNEVRQDMQESIKPRLEAFWESGIRGADFFMSAIGPGLEPYSRYDEVRRASGETVAVGEFLDEVRRIVLEFVLQRVMKQPQAQDQLDEPSQFALLALWAYGYEFPSDEARKLAQSGGVELLLLERMHLVKVSGEKASVLKAKTRIKHNEKLGLPLEQGGSVPIIDALHRALLVTPKGRQDLSDYLEAVSYREAETFWRTAQAFAEVLEGEDEGRALDELLTLRDNLPKPTENAQAGLFG